MGYSERDAMTPATKTRIALIGCGAWGRNIARALARLGALEVICDTAADGLRSFASELGTTATDDAAAVFARDDIAAVAIATPAAGHAATARLALEAGKHVFVEKPIALDIGEARALAALAEERSRVLMVGHLLHYHPLFARLLELIREGVLGRVRYVFSNRLNQGRVRTEENALWSLAPHDISMILAIAGRKPVHVTAEGHAAVQPALADLATVHLEFGGGLKAHVFCSWLNPYKEHRLAVVGDKAMAVFEDSAPHWDDKLILYRHRVEMRDGVPEFVKAAGERVPVAEARPLDEEMRHFLECVETGRPARTGPAEAIPVLEVLTAAERAIEG